MRVALLKNTRALQLIGLLLFYVSSLNGQVPARILPLGNSITDGSYKYNSYRRALWHMLDSAGYSVDFIGSKHLNGIYDSLPPNPDFDMDHEGHSGWTSHDLLTGPKGWDTIRGNIYQWISSYTPDIVLMEIGTNDVFGCQLTDSILSNIEKVIAVIRKKNPDVKFLLAQALPLGGSDILGFDDTYCGNHSKKLNDYIIQLNSKIPGFAKEKSTITSPVVVVDQYTGVDPKIDLYDGIHPNAKGEIKMAGIWYDGLVKLLPKPKSGQTTYYVSPAGNDKSSGISPSQAWKTISKVNNMDFSPGDLILFEGGQTFTGNIYVGPEDGGTSSMPVVFSSYGNGRAVIDAGYGSGILVNNTGGIEIRNLNFAGSGADKNKKEGIYFYTDLTNGQKLVHISIDSVDVHGFGKSGICLGSWHNSYPGFEDVRITHVRSTDNETGMNSYDMADWKSTMYAHKNVYIADCEFLNNISSGIVLCGFDSSIVEYCRASNTGITGHGTVAIWAWSCKNLTFQHCIADNTITDGPDGGGYDLDGGTENCIIQYCYSYKNAGPGYMHCDYPYSRPTRNNIIRYNLSENDGRKSANDRCSYLFVSWGNGLENCHMYNNTGYISDNASYTVYGFWGTIIYGNGDEPHITNCTARNNIFYVQGDNHFLVKLDGGIHPLTTSNLLLQDNCYYASGEVSTRWLDNQSIYYNLKSWQDATSQEIFNTQRTGFNLNPLVHTPGEAGLVNNPHILPEMQAYRLELNSPMINSGLNLYNLFGFEVGTIDFFGNHLFTGPGTDIGFYESPVQSGIKVRLTGEDDVLVFPNPIEKGNSFKVESKMPMESIRLISSEGRYVLEEKPGDSFCRVHPSPGLAAGMYFLQILNQRGDLIIKKVLVE